MYVCICKAIREDTVRELGRCGVLESAQLAGALGLDQSGGHVDMYRGQTSDGRAWVQNSTRQGEHPLVGHIVRSIEQDPKDGRFYVRTDGTGQGSQGHDNAAARHFGNTIVGPPTFNSLDRAMNDRIVRDHPNLAPPAPSLSVGAP